MASHGGARNRSGPPKDPTSARSEREGISLTALPNEGYQGEIPEFPLSDPSSRELEIWEWLWSLPQAAAWSLDKWRWMQIGNLARLQARSEAPDAPASLATSIRQLSADHGLTTAGLIENGWQIAAPQINKVADKTDSEDSGTGSEQKERPQRRMRAV